MIRRPAPHGAVVALLATLALALAACGEKHERPRRRRTEPPDARARLLPQRRPRRHLRGAGARRVPPPGLDVRIVDAVGPGRAAEAVQAGRADLAISYEPELLLARDKGADVVSSRRARPAAADVDHVASARARITRAGRAARQARRHGRHPLPVGLPEDDPRSAPASTRPRSSEVERRLQPRAGDALDKVDATLGAFWNYEGVQLQRAGKHPHDHPRRQGRRPDLQRARARRPRRRAARGRRALRRFLQALAAATSRCAATPRRASTRSEGQPRPRPRAPARGGARDAARLLPRRPAQPFGWQDPARGRPTATGCSTQRPAQAAAGDRAGADQRVPAGRGARAADASPGRRERAHGRSAWAPARPAQRAVGREELAHLAPRSRAPAGRRSAGARRASGRRGRRPAAVVAALAVQREHLDRPAPDAGDRAQPPPAALVVGRAQVDAAAATSRAARRSASARPARRSKRLQQRGRDAGQRGRRRARRAARSRGQRRPERRARSARWIAAARSNSMSCSQTAQASASNGLGPAAGRAATAARARERPDQRVVAEALVERRAGRRRRRARSACARDRLLATAARSGPQRAEHDPVARRAGRAHDHRPRRRRAAGARARRRGGARRRRCRRRGSRKGQRGGPRADLGRERRSRAAREQVHVDEERARGHDLQRRRAGRRARRLGASRRGLGGSAAGAALGTTTARRRRRRSRSRRPGRAPRGAPAARAARRGGRPARPRSSPSPATKLVAATAAAWRPTGAGGAAAGATAGPGGSPTATASTTSAREAGSRLGGGHPRRC